MVGIIISGHGNFASGLTSSVELVVGKQDNFKALDFVDGATQEDLYSAMTQAVEEMADCEKVIIFTDLVGGTPFKMAATLQNANDKVITLCGTNLGMVIEGTMARQFIEGDALANSLLNTGKTQIIRFEGIKEEADDDMEDGI